MIRVVCSPQLWERWTALKQTMHSNRQISYAGWFPEVISPFQIRYWSFYQTETKVFVSSSSSNSIFKFPKVINLIICSSVNGMLFIKYWFHLLCVSGKVWQKPVNPTRETKNRCCHGSVVTLLAGYIIWSNKLICANGLLHLPGVLFKSLKLFIIIRVFCTGQIHLLFVFYKLTCWGKIGSVLPLAQHFHSREGRTQ